MIQSNFEKEMGLQALLTGGLLYWLADIVLFCLEGLTFLANLQYTESLSLTGQARGPAPTWLRTEN